jgi:hypothetical protein
LTGGARIEVWKNQARWQANIPETQPLAPHADLSRLYAKSRARGALHIGQTFFVFGLRLVSARSRVKHGPTRACRTHKQYTESEW